MKLKRIRVENFRQFYGTQVLEVAGESEKNVTLVHAENGIGKTTLLNAILWCFYGETTKKFERAEEIVNFQAASEKVSSACVEVALEHDGNDYLVQRTFTARSGKRGDSSLHANKIVRGVYTPLDASESFINSVVPKEMARYYFFDGEQAETFSSETNYKVVGQAIRNMLGCNLVENAIQDLEASVGSINDLIGEVPGDSEIEEVTKRLNGIDNRHRNQKEELQRKIEEQEALEDQIRSILDKLREAEGAKGIQKLRDEKVLQLRKVEDRLKLAQSAVVKWVGTKTIPLIATRLNQDTLSFINEQSLKGRIPSPYNEEFVRGLLSAEQCVCDRPLKAGTAEWKAVSQLLKEAATADLLGRIVRARSRIGTLRESRADAPKLLENEQKTIASCLGERRTLEQQIGELGKQLENIPTKEIAEREKAHQELAQRAKKVTEEIGALNHTISQLDRLKKESQSQLDKLAGTSAKTRRLMVRRALADRGAELLELLLHQHEDDARKTIADLINKILETTARREYRFAFRDNFAMELLFPDGRSVPRSGGENQLMTLAFIAALIQFSLDRSKAKGDELFVPGVVAPLVLDSPFGQLDKKYRIDTAMFIPKMASQVVLLVSSSQGDEPVISALKPHVGKEYVLISENTGPRGMKSDDLIVLNNKSIATSLFNRPKNLTRIEEVH